MLHIHYFLACLFSSFCLWLPHVCHACSGHFYSTYKNLVHFRIHSGYCLKMTYCKHMKPTIGCNQMILKVYLFVAWLIQRLNSYTNLLFLLISILVWFLLTKGNNIQLQKNENHALIGLYGLKVGYSTMGPLWHIE